MLVMAEPDMRLGEALSRARERVGFSQDEVALLVGQQRPVISNWESGKRRPNSHQLAKLSAIYRVPLETLLGAEEKPRPDFERLMFRDAGDRLDPGGKYEIQRFLSFLDAYSDLLEALDEPPGMTRAPFSVREGFVSKEDIRRKAEEARRLFRIGDGPVGDLVGLADLAGITVYFAALGGDLKSTVSGAFLPHDRVGFAILVNAETTPGRQEFTLAHELGHALFHGDHVYVGYYGRRELAERFASAFAAEFLVPTHSLRAAVEGLSLTKVRDPEVVVHLQRLFGVSYAMMLVRLGNANLATEADIERLREVQPVHLAERLGYTTEPDEWGQHPERLGIARFPRRFLRILRRAAQENRITISGAAAIMGLAEEDVEEFLSDLPAAAPDAEEFEYISASA
jgi:Zn-dependent peptidase ImmA (M78 family)/transcriptional regulator with XRE-family HTH domain